MYESGASSALKLRILGLGTIVLDVLLICLASIRLRPESGGAWWVAIIPPVVLCAIGLGLCYRSKSAAILMALLCCSLALYIVIASIMVVVTISGLVDLVFVVIGIGSTLLFFTPCIVIWKSRAALRRF